MTIQLSVAVRNAMLDAIEATAGTGALLRLYTGAPPANCAASEAGTKLVEWTLASDWSANASSGTKSLSGVPLTVAAVAGGTVAHFRIYNSAGSTCHMQGTVTATGGGGDAIMDNLVISAGQNIDVNSFTLTGGNP